MKKYIVTYFLAVMTVISYLVPCFSFSAKEVEKEVEVPVKYYEFDEGIDYDISNSGALQKIRHSEIGKLTVSGNFKEGEKDGIPAYTVSNDESLSLKFIYDDTLKNASDSEWHIKKDSGNKVDGIKLENDIDRGAIILQTSLDGKKWATVFEKTDFANDVKLDSDKDANYVRLANGCYYRVIVAYKIEKEIGSKEVFSIETPIKEHDDFKNAQVYDFYASYENTDENFISGEKFYFPSGAKDSKYTVATKKNNYAGSEKIEKNDPHYGWNLGNFCLSGYTDKGDDDDVYLKKVGNKVKLTFKLEQDIKKLNGNSNLVIAEDEKGSDEEFKVQSHNMKHGELIIHHTDSENKTNEIKYSDFLSALSSQNADTTIQLFEEGDYEVHLDYTITDKKGIDSDTHYQTSFKFKIRNANCMVYIFDAESGAELSNGDVTENGFRIDTAKSSYPKLQVKKEILNNTKNGLVEDTRFNGAATDGEIFTDDGIYTVKAYNRYDDKLEPAVKTIYVGNNNILTAYTKHLGTSNEYTIQEINNLIKDGYKINDDGDIIEPVTTTTTITTTTTETITETTTTITNTEITTKETSAKIAETSKISSGITTTAVSEKNNKEIRISVWLIILFIGIIFILLTLVVILLLKKKKGKKR